MKIYKKILKRNIISQEEINDAVDNGGDDSGILFWTGEGNPTDPKIFQMIRMLRLNRKNRLWI